MGPGALLKNRALSMSKTHPNCSAPSDQGRPCSLRALLGRRAGEELAVLILGTHR
jgi:hypothetical protein